MKQFWAAVALMLAAVLGHAQSHTAPRTPLQFSDDSWVHVPLQFAFPLHGVTFTSSFMFSNGVVAFMGVGQTPRTTYCCSGENITTGSSPVFNYSIMPMQTDLLPVQQSQFWTEGNSQYQRYHWGNIAEYSNRNNLNTFSVEIRPSGYIGIQYDLVNIRNQVVTSAVVGNAALGEFTVNYHGRGMAAASVPGNIEFATTGNVCVVDPLSNPSCPGYAEAYQVQQCSINPLYNSACAGYASAHHDQQCAANPLYAVTCNGYTEAYFNQQCSIDPLYNSGCGGYTEAYQAQQCSINPLYAVTCNGYEQAYFNQQCSINPLYAVTCNGYEQAYFNQQCSINPLYAVTCNGYEQAYFNQQCSINPLYNSGCGGYEQAYFNQQCSVSALYDPACPGHAQARFAQQCSADQLSDSKCPDYAKAYAVKYVVPAAGASNAVTAEPATEVVQVSATDATSPISPTSVTSVIKPTDPVAARPSLSGSAPAPESKRSTPPAPAPTARTALAQRIAARQAAQQSATQLAERMSNAATIEQQQAAQELVIGAMGSVPGFSAYQNAVIPDGRLYRSEQVYRDQRTVDNARALRQLNSASDRLHQSLVDQQYKP